MVAGHEWRLVKAQNFLAENVSVLTIDTFIPATKLAWRLDDQVKGVGHQAERMHLPIGLDAAFDPGFQKTLPIPVVLEDGLASVATVHHVINGSRVLDSQLARHGVESAIIPF